MINVVNWRKPDASEALSLSVPMGYRTPAMAAFFVYGAGAGAGTLVKADSFMRMRIGYDCLLYRQIFSKISRICCCLILVGAECALSALLT